MAVEGEALVEGPFSRRWAASHFPSDSIGSKT
ncbi:hypothetical protein COLO4_00287 [Corchorus olitorius]|uniref:Uncharacterized protein n=1 Tax=Corchorus olitorius TaxID=93759 RepID=A0A1R3L441_9ROSI|nr:hypothetical protein COLO4_00287 [Corchorus olitorius]